MKTADMIRILSSVAEDLDKEATDLMALSSALVLVGKEALAARLERHVLNADRMVLSLKDVLKELGNSCPNLD